MAASELTGSRAVGAAHLQSDGEAVLMRKPKARTRVEIAIWAHATGRTKA